MREKKERRFEKVSAKKKVLLNFFVEVVSKMSFLLVIFASMLITANAQRSPYAGSRPASGYKDQYLTQSPQTDSNGADIGNRDGVITSGTTERLPYDAKDDAYIVNYWNALPVDQRPFWIVNQGHIEAQRGTPSRQPAAPTTGSTASNQTPQTPSNNQGIANRIDDSSIQSQSQQQPSTPNNQNINTISQQEVVYPSNVTPEQRLEMEIQFLQQRLEKLVEQRRRNQANQQQISSNTQNRPNSQSQRNF